MKDSSNPKVRKATEGEILKSAIASFKIENILITDEMAQSAMEKAKLRFLSSQASFEMERTENCDWNLPLPTGRLKPTPTPPTIS